VQVDLNVGWYDLGNFLRLLFGRTTLFYLPRQQWLRLATWIFVIPAFVGFFQVAILALFFWTLFIETATRSNVEVLWTAAFGIVLVCVVDHFLFWSRVYPGWMKKKFQEAPLQGIPRTQRGTAFTRF
jgi:hypothetical protein